MKKNIFFLVTLSCITIFASSVFATVQKDSIYVGSQKVTIVIEKNLYDMKRCKLLLQYALAYMPKSWRIHVKQFVFTTHPRKKLFFWVNNPNIIAEYQPFFDLVRYYMNLRSDEPQFFYMSLVHEYAHANSCMRRLSKWGFIPRLFRLMRDPLRYKSPYAEGYDFFLTRMEEFWAEISAMALTRPYFMKKYYPKDFAFVQDVIYKTDPQHNIITHFARLNQDFERVVASLIAKYPHGKIIQKGKTIILQTSKGKNVVVHTVRYRLPRLSVYLGCPKNLKDSVHFASSDVLKKQNFMVRAGDSVVLIDGHVYLLSNR